MGNLMPISALNETFGTARLDHDTRRLLDHDLLTFCTRQPQLSELAFTLADHGHTHVGHLVQLSHFTLLDLAGGHADLAGGLRHRLQLAGLDTGSPCRTGSRPSATRSNPHSTDRGIAVLRRRTMFAEARNPGTAT